MSARPTTADASLYPLLDPEASRILRIGGLLSLVPVVGWPIVLGYRRALVEHLYEPHDAAMPRWRGRLREHFLAGLAAVGVTQVYLAPAWLLLGVLLLSGRPFPGPELGILCGATVVAPVLSNLALPLLCVVLATPIAGAPLLSATEAACVLSLFALLTFLLPAAFLRVGWQGRFLAAFQVGAVVRFIARRPREYCKAWFAGIAMNGVAAGLYLLAPWALMWAYVGSVVAFYCTTAEADVAAGFGRADRGGWLARALGLADHWGRSTQAGQVLVVRPWGLPIPVPSGSLLGRFRRRF